jgi:hypothetical protein
VSSKGEEADGGQREYDPYWTELTKSRCHVRAGSILPAFQGFPLACQELHWRCM